MEIDLSLSAPLCEPLSSFLFFISLFRLSFSSPHFPALHFLYCLVQCRRARGILVQALIALLACHA